MVPTFLQIAALVLLLLATFDITVPKAKLEWLGLACYVAAGVWVTLKLPL